MAVGVDIEDISRFIDRDKSFIERIFTPLEIEYCQSFSKPESHYAVRFCAKEAVIKALSGFDIHLAEYKLIEIYLDKNNCPQVRILKDLGRDIKFELSLSHDRTKAVAFVYAN